MPTRIVDRIEWQFTTGLPATFQHKAEERRGPEWSVEYRASPGNAASTGSASPCGRGKSRRGRSRKPCGLYYRPPPPRISCSMRRPEKMPGTGRCGCRTPRSRELRQRPDHSSTHRPERGRPFEPEWAGGAGAAGRGVTGRAAADRPAGQAAAARRQPHRSPRRQRGALDVDQEAETTTRAIEVYFKPEVKLLLLPVLPAGVEYLPGQPLRPGRAPAARPCRDHGDRAAQGSPAGRHRPYRLPPTRASNSPSRKH